MQPDVYDSESSHHLASSHNSGGRRSPMGAVEVNSEDFDDLNLPFRPELRELGERGDRGHDEIMCQCHDRFRERGFPKHHEKNVYFEYQVDSNINAT